MSDFIILEHHCFKGGNILDIFKKRGSTAVVSDYSMLLGCRPERIKRMVNSSWKILELY